MSTQLGELNTLYGFVEVDGKIGQPRLRHNGSELHVMLDRRFHLLALYVIAGTSQEVANHLDDLNGSVENILSDTLDELEQLLNSANIEAQIDAFVLLPQVDESAGQSFSDRLPLEQTVFSSGVAHFPVARVEELQTLTEATFELLSGLLFPKRSWKRIELVRDEGRLERRERRVELENQLLSRTWGLNLETIIIRGVPGSGKSLMLVSRACWLAAAMPERNILLVTWNRSLVSALTEWLSVFELADIEVMTLADYLRRHAIELDLTDPADADARCREMLDRRKFEPEYDAILIDEAQDFGAVLLELMRRFLRQGRGGMTVAMDSVQNLRDRPAIECTGLPAPLELIELKRCYRSTDIIHRFSHAFAGYDVPDAAKVAEETEERIRLVWAETSEDCTQMIVAESLRLIRDVGLHASEIMVVTFDGSQRREIIKAFDEKGRATASPGNADSHREAIRIASPEVAKGHEASCVFVVGWDKNDDDSEIAAARRFVAASRAADILYVVYTSQEYGGLHAESDSMVIKQLWPDDFELVQEG